MEPDRTIRIVIAEDHRLFREGICLLLNDQKNLEIVGEAANGLQAIDMIGDLNPVITPVRSS